MKLAVVFFEPTYTRLRVIKEQVKARRVACLYRALVMLYKIGFTVELSNIAERPAQPITSMNVGDSVSPSPVINLRK